MTKEKFAIFIDAENLINWIKNDGPEKLLEELSTQGQVIVRRAYGKWTNLHLSQLQENLNRNGFELLHNFHPVSGKNSSDIQMTVDRQTIII
ncbi:MAG: NYN domain-containing protein [Fibrobacter sp.]|mgnify:FL=1|nr:NYN domain-containing protein [Fibrobacter sp.]